MKKLGYVLLCAVLMVALKGVLTASAQDTVDPTTLAYVVKAYANTLASTSFHIESKSQTQVNGQQGGVAPIQTASYDLVKTADGWNVNGKRNIALTTQNGSVNVEFDTTIVDGEVYMQITGMPAFQRPQGQGNGQGGQNAQGGQGQDQSGQGSQPPAQGQGGQGGPSQGGGFTIPQGWFDLTKMVANGQRVPGVGAADAKTLLLTLLDALNLPVTAQSVTALKELPADNIDNQSMRVIQITIDPATILQSDAAALLSGGFVGFGGGFGGFGGGFGGFGRRGQGGQNGQGAPAGQNGQPPAQGNQNGQAPADQGQGGQGGQNTQGQGTFPTRTPPNPADYQVTFAIYIGDNDQLIHRIYSVIAISPSATDANGNPLPGRTITTQTDFSNFGTPVTITAPQVSS